MKTRMFMALCGISISVAACDDNPRQSSSSDARQAGQEASRDANRDGTQPATAAQANRTGQANQAGEANRTARNDGANRAVTGSNPNHANEVARVDAEHLAATRKCNALESDARLKCTEAANTSRHDAMALADLRNTGTQGK